MSEQLRFDVEEQDKAVNELELEVVKYYTIDSLAFSVNAGQLDRDKAIELLEAWFPIDKVAISALYKQISDLRKA